MGQKGIFDVLKEGVSFAELEQFAKKHITQIFSLFALIIATISSAFDFFTGPKLSIFFLMLGILIALFSVTNAEKWLRQIYSFTLQQEKTTEIVIGSLKIVIGMFIPFIYFGLIGIMAGTSYHYYLRQAEILRSNAHNHPHSSSEEPD